MLYVYDMSSGPAPRQAKSRAEAPAPQRLPQQELALRLLSVAESQQPMPGQFPGRDKRR